MSTVETNLLARLDSVARQARRIRWAYGIGGFLFVVVTAILLTSLLDYGFSVRDIWTRRLLTWCVWAMAAWGGFKFVWPAWRFRPTRLEIALRVERFFPQLRNRLSSAIAFLEGPDDDAIGMFRLTIHQAEKQMQGLPMHRCLSAKVATQMVGWVLGSVVFTSAIAAMAPEEARIALQRLAFPSVRRHNLQWVTAPAKVAEGQDAQFELVDKRGRRLPDEVWFEWERRLPTGDVQTERQRMHRTADGTMRVTLTNVLASFRYRAYGGDDDTLPQQTLEVVSAVAIASARLTIKPPNYTSIRSYTANRTNVKTLIGSRLSLTLALTKAVRKAELVGAAGVFFRESAVTGRITKRGKSVRFESYVDDSRPNQGDLLITGSGPLNLVVTDTDGVTISLPVAKIVAVADQPPAVAVDWTVMRRILTRSAKISVRIFVMDDFATRDVSVIVESVRGTRQRDNRPAGDAGGAIDDTHLEQGELAVRAAVAPRLDQLLTLEESIWQGPKIATAQDWQASRPLEKKVVVWTLDAVAERLAEGDSLTVVFSATDYRGGRRESEQQRWTVVSPSELDAMLRAQQAQGVEYLREAAKRQLASSQRLNDALKGKLTPSQAMDLAAVDGRNAQQTLMQHALPLLEDVLQTRLANALQESTTEHPLRDTVGRLSELLSTDFPAFFHQIDQWSRASTAAKPSHLATAASNGAEIATRLVGIVEQLVVWNQQENAGEDIARVVHDQQELFNDTEQFRLDQLSHNAQNTADLRDELMQRQAALAQRYERWLHDIEDLAARDPSSFGDVIAVALELGIGSRMRETVDDLRDDQLGEATRQQEELIDDLNDLAARLRSGGRHGQGSESTDTEAFREVVSRLWQQQIELNKRTIRAELDQGDALGLSDEQHGIGRNLQQVTQSFEMHRAAMTTTAELAIETADRLSGGRLGRQVQADQQMIAESLEAMVARPGEDDLPSEHGSEERDPHDSSDVPQKMGPTAEDWKVVQRWQESVLRRTETLHQLRMSGELIDESARALADRQQQVTDLVRRLTSESASQDPIDANKTNLEKLSGQEPSQASDRRDTGNSELDSPPLNQRDALIDDLLNIDTPADVGDPGASADADKPKPSPEQDMLLEMAVQMGDVAKRLRMSDVGSETQQLQNEILAKISEQLKRVRQRQDRTGNQRQAAGDSASDNGSVGDNAHDPRGTDPRTPPEGMELTERTWAQLPARVRAQLRNSPESRFLPRYELRIEQYYQRLSSQGAEP
jgi:hypothetical protein